jgi:hypothetical protein
VAHQRQRLPLRFESRDNLGRIHPRADQLQRDRAAHRVALLGAKHDPHPALADQLFDVVGADRFPSHCFGSKPLSASLTIACSGWIDCGEARSA